MMRIVKYARWTALAAAASIGAFGIFAYFGLYGGAVPVGAVPVLVALVLLWAVETRTFLVGWGAIVGLGATSLALRSGVGGAFLPLVLVGGLGFGFFHWAVQSQESSATGA